MFIYIVKIALNCFHTLICLGFSLRDIGVFMLKVAPLTADKREGKTYCSIIYICNLRNILDEVRKVLFPTKYVWIHFDFTVHHNRVASTCAIGLWTSQGRNNVEKQFFWNPANATLERDEIYRRVRKFELFLCGDFTSRHPTMTHNT